MSREVTTLEGEFWCIISNSINQVMKDIVDKDEIDNETLMSRTPNMANIKISSNGEGVDEMVEIDTPDERELVRKLSGRKLNDRDDDRDEDVCLRESGSERETMSGFREGSLPDKYAAWNNYQLVHRFGEQSPEKVKAQPQPERGWSCSHCTFFNEKELAWVCECCGSAKGRQNLGNNCKKSASNTNGRVQNTQESWCCKSCSFENEDTEAKRCLICDTKRDTEEVRRSEWRSD